MEDSIFKTGSMEASKLKTNNILNSDPSRHRPNQITKSNKMRFIKYVKFNKSRQNKISWIEENLISILPFIWLKSQKK